MALLNPTFQDAGPTPGTAAHWTLRSVSGRERIAAFGPAPSRAQEDFEGWFDLVTELSPGTFVIAIFDSIPEAIEDFEEAWDADAFVGELVDAIIETASFGGSGAEDMQEGWLTAPFAISWADVTSDGAVFGSEALERFETWTLPMVPDWSRAWFDVGANGAETFAGSWPVAKTF